MGVFTNAIEALAAPVLGPLFGIIDQFVTDKDKAAEMKHEATMGMQRFAQALMEAQADAIKGDQQSQSWLPRNIRPMFLLFLMIFIGVSVVGGMMGFADAIAAGWAAVPEGAWVLAQICLGGYITGRTIEKVAGATGAVTAVKKAVSAVIPRWQRDKDWQK